LSNLAKFDNCFYSNSPKCDDTIAMYVLLWA
jgi:hypothetical protein